MIYQRQCHCDFIRKTGVLAFWFSRKEALLQTYFVPLTSIQPSYFKNNGSTKMHQNYYTNIKWNSKNKNVFQPKCKKWSKMMSSFPLNYCHSIYQAFVMLTSNKSMRALKSSVYNAMQWGISWLSLLWVFKVFNKKSHSGVWPSEQICGDHRTMLSRQDMHDNHSFS